MGRSVTPLWIALFLGSGVTLAQAQRPGPGERYEPGVELLSFAAPDGRVRVWYVLDTADAVPAEDTAPADGIPDYVADVAAVAEESHRTYVDELGFRAPLADTELLPPEAAGGDERLDIYLLDFGEADGAFHSEACTPAEAGVEHCTGYMLVENDFAETSYPSLGIAVRVVVSHEYFHAVQNAYDAGQDIKWSEGSAVWAEELAYPEQDDYEGFVSRFLEKTFRPFDRPSGASFGDPYPYGAALWPAFLTERYGAEIVRQVWEACEGNVDFVTATADVLEREHGVTLGDAWLEFSLWNLFTGERADPARAYRDTAGLPSVFLEPALSGDGFERWHPIEGLSARYVPVTLPDVGGEPRELRATAEDLSGTVVTAFLWDGTALSPAMPLVAGDEAGRVSLTLQWEGTPTMFVVLTGTAPGKPSRRITLGLGPAAGEPTPDAGPGGSPDAGPGGGDAGGGGGDGGGGGCQLAGSSPGGGLVPVLAGLAWLCMRRRRPGRQRALAGVIVLAAMLLAREPVWAQTSAAPPAPSTPATAEPKTEDKAAETSAEPRTEEEPSDAPNEQPAGAGPETEEEPSPAPHVQPSARPKAGGPPAANAAAKEESSGRADEAEEIIVITGSRMEQPLSQSTVATEVITREEIASSGAPNVAALLVNHPGIEIVQGLRGSGVRMQGLDPEYAAVLVDGRRVIGRIDGVLDLEGMAVGDIERIEIVKGPSSALYGSDALAGVIHIITRKPEQPLTGEARAQYGSFGALDLYTAAGTRTGAWTGRVSAGWRQGDGYDLSPETPDTTASSYDEKQISGQASRALGGVELSLSGDYLRRDLYGVDIMAPAVFDVDNVVEQVATALDARWQPSATGRLTGALRYSLYRDQFLQDQRGSAAGDRYEETMQHLAELTIQHADRLGASHDVVAGVDSAIESLTGARIAEDATERYRAALFAQDDWRLDEDPFLRLAMGARLDLDSQFGVHATPKVALRWDPDPRITGRIGYGWGFRSPDFKELYLEFDNPGVGYRVRGNPDLEPETSQSVNAGIEARPHPRVWASLGAYYNDFENLIDILDQTPDDGIAGPDFSYVNVASAFTRGVESQIRVEPLTGLSADLSYTYLDTRDRALDRALPCRPRHQSSLALTYAHGSTQGTVRGRFVGVRRLCPTSDPEEMDGETTADRYVTLDARVSQSLFRRFTLFVGASNLLDEGDAELLPIAPRTFYGGAQVNY